MNKFILISFLLLICLSKVQSQENYFKPLFSAILDSSEGRVLLHQCSRSVPVKNPSYWNPVQNDIDILQNNFKKVCILNGNDWGSINGKVDSLQKFGFQYLGVIINDKKYIYINAFPFREVEKLKSENYDLSKKSLVVCDGGRYFWGVLFDTETMKFSYIAFNGRG
jgi:hypothetical protein